jgi:predicted alpha/beta superfamily hydrolase
MTVDAQLPPWTLRELMSLVPAEAALRNRFFTVEPPRVMRAPEYGWDHEIRVALPVSYAEGERTYPVLWITDNLLETALAVFAQVPTEVILVAVGAGLVTRGEWIRRRSYDFYPVEDVFPEGPAGDCLRQRGAALDPELSGLRTGGGAGRFLDFLIDEVRPALAADYRTDPHDHALVGYSAGGTFATYAMFARPEAFAKYLCCSPSLYACRSMVFDLEDRYACEHRDLRVSAFFSAGEAEATESSISPLGCLSSMARMAEILSFRAYPSLELAVRVFPGETHATIFASALRWGVATLWGKAIVPEIVQTKGS